MRSAAEAGLCVKVNSVLLPGENDAEIPLVARRVADLGAYIHNVLPLIPRPDARRRAAPSQELVDSVRAQCAACLTQFTRCRHCRADAIIDAEE